MKIGEDVVKILEAFDLLQSYRAAAKFVGCDHHTVKKYVRLRDAGKPVVQAVRRARAVDGFLEKIEEWVETSEGSVRADVCHEKLLAMGYSGSERTTRRAVSEVKKHYRKGRLRVYRPWLPEPGLWLQFDWGDGPVVSGRKASLFCAWLAWSRYRVVIPVLDRTSASLILCLDRVFRLLAGIPTYALTDNEKTVTTEHVAGIPVRNPLLAQVGEHYGVTIATCVRADPESKGGSEATVKIAKADLLPTRMNLRGEYQSFAELEDACEAFNGKVNNRVHRVTNRVPSEMLLEERQRLHTVPQVVFVQAVGEERRVTKDATVVYQGARYSVPHELALERVLVRRHGGDVIISHAESGEGLREIARHEAAEKGSWRIDDAHYPPAPEGPLFRNLKPHTPLEREFLQLGEGAEAWLRAAAEAGASQIRRKMRHAVDLSAYHGKSDVDSALQQAAAAQRFEHDDLTSILQYQGNGRPGAYQYAFDAPSLQAGTRAWEGFGQ